MNDASEPYKVGKWYDMPVVITNGANYGIFIWPVIGPLHNDKEYIKFDHDHYHIDWRFVNPVNYGNVTAPMYAGGELGIVIHQKNVLKMETRRLRCQRIFNQYPDLGVRWRPVLEQAYQSATLGPKRICPHRGADLSTIEPVDGLITCPLHGLKWCTHTGQLQPSTTLTIG